MSQTKTIQMYINAADKKSTISKNIYGNFSEHLGRCIYEGIFVGKNSPIPNTDGIRNDVIEAFRQIRLPVLRWPGGCFADEYHWKDGIGDPAGRKKMINTHWGGVTEDNSFGTHEFLRLCELVGCEPYINGNLGSGTVEEMSQWVEYITNDGVSEMSELRAKNGHPAPWTLKYFGVGNENWGCGGWMTPEYYANEYRRYQTYCRNYGKNRLFRIACGPSGNDYQWMQKLLEGVPANLMDGISLHHYSAMIWNHEDRYKHLSRSATKFGEDEYYWLINQARLMDEILTRQDGIMTRFDPQKKLALIVDEWGAWHNVEPGTNPGFLYQQNTMRDAIIAAVTLDIFNRHSDRVRMANIAQAVNVLQSVLLTEGAKLVRTPTFHVFDLYSRHQDAELVYSYNENETAGGEFALGTVSQTVSVKDGALHITASNLALDRDYEIRCDIRGFSGSRAEARVLTGAFNACNDFDTPERVCTVPAEVTLAGETLTFKLPACSVAAITLR